MRDRESQTSDAGRRVLTVALLAVLTAGIWLTALWHRYDRERELERRAERAVSEIADRIVSSLAERHAEMLRLQKFWPRSPVEEAEPLRSLAALAAAQSPGLLEIHWIDPRGALLWSTRSPARAGLADQPRAAPTFHLARRTGQAESTPALPLGGRSEWGFVTFLPVAEGRGVVGAVFGFRQLLASELSAEQRELLDLRLVHDGVEVWRLSDQSPGTAEGPASFASQVEELPETAYGAALLIENYRYRLEGRKRPGVEIGLFEPWPLLLAAHGLALLLVWGVDRLERRRSDLRSQAHLMDGVFSNLPVTAFSLRPDGSVERSYGKAARGLGLTSSGGETLDSFPVLLHPLRRALAGESVHLEADLEVEGGDLRTFELFLLHDELRGGGALGFAIDVSARKWMEKALQSSEERYRRFFRDAPFAYFAVDGNGRIELANTLATELTGYAPEELHGLACSELFVGKEGSAFFLELDLEETIRNIEIQISRADGTTFWSSLSVQPLHDDQKYVGSGLIVIDITRRKSLQEQVRQSQKMEAVGRLAGGIAHDFNNLLTAIMGYARMGLDKVGEPGRVERNLEEIQKACKRATSLVSQLLAFSRRQIIEPKIFDLNELLRDMDPMLRRLTREEVELVSHLSRDLGRVRMDPGQMEQVIVNLVVNAQEAIAGSGWVTLETDNYRLDEGFGSGGTAVEPVEMVRLRISDTGSGMRPEVQEHIFEPFFTTKEDLSGTGLGLATVYGIVVEQSSGQIEVHSEMGEGTTISVLLPRVYGAIDLEDEPVPLAEPVGGSARILLVEDEEMVRELAAEMLTSLGYEVMQAKNGLDALEAVEGREREIELLLTDVVMPKMGGEKLYLELRKRHPEIRVLYSSGYTESAVIHHGVKEGEVPFVHKPYTFDALAHAVQSVLKR